MNWGIRQHPLSILGEGNTSVRINARSFLVKASGSNLATLREPDLVECRADLLLQMLDETGLSDAQVDGRLMKSRVDSKAKKPSVESLFHAWFLTLPGVNYVGHTHAPAVNGILCSPRAREFADRRILPDEIVCCDVASVFVPYTDPGLRLAQEICHVLKCSLGNFTVRRGWCCWRTTASYRWAKLSRACWRRC